MINIVIGYDYDAREFEKLGDDYLFSYMIYMNSTPEDCENYIYKLGIVREDQDFARNVIRSDDDKGECFSITSTYPYWAGVNNDKGRKLLAEILQLQ